jgi:DNA polymerase-3 subunit epsilon
MKNKNKIWWALSISLSLAALLGLALVILFWQQSTDQSGTAYWGIARYTLIICLALIALIGFLLSHLFWKLVIPLSKVSEEIALIYAANPNHRIDVSGAYGLGQLVYQINSAAEKYKTLEKSVFKRVQVAKAELEEEKNILAAIMAELPDAVLICNKENRIILYNSQAKRFFSERTSAGRSSVLNAKTESVPDAVSGKVHLGIGRPISDFVEENIIQYALAEIHQRLENNEEHVSSNFVITDLANRLLRAEASPILSPQREFSGFVIIFNEITQDLRGEALSGFLLQSFQQKIRHSVASIKSAIEVIRDYPAVSTAQQQHLMKIIHTESQSLEQLIQREGNQTLKQPHNHWPTMPIAIDDLIEALQKKASEKMGIELSFDFGSTAPWIKVDTYAIIMVLLFFMQRIGAEADTTAYQCAYSQEGEFAFIDFIWGGKPVSIETIRQWESMQLVFLDERMPLHPKEILEHHGIEIWPYREHHGEQRSFLRMYVPVFRPQEQKAVRRASVLPESRPEFYAFDLFNQPGQSPNMDTHLLKNLAYTVFDTETTGLDPAGGDEIISIGALRIISGHILTEESFDRLINPQRRIPASSIQIHGIDNDMVRNQPTIDVVLPDFFKFTEETILVAHNAAFDMRMLQMCEKRTGVKFIQPVLDTLLLSAVAHSANDDHTLSAIAGRLGVTVAGRHTAMGDALMTANIFLKLISLLADMGIHTLGEAREASQQTYYARLKF